MGAPPTPFTPAPRPRRSAPPGFTLVEILITISLLAFIIVGLFAVFNQVQRAFRSGMSQVDRLAAGRAVTELLPRELEQITPSGAPYPYGANFYARTPNSTPLVQSLPGTSIQRTNLLQDCFMLLRQNQTWVGIGYCVRVSDANGRLWWPETENGSGQMGAGSLYRYAATLPVVYNTAGAPNNGLPQDPTQMFRDFLKACGNGAAESVMISNRICDGVTHFRFRAFNTNGMLITRPLRWATDVLYSTTTPGEIGLYQFCSNAVPASLEMEFGILEQSAMDRYNSIGAAAARLAYLQRPDISSRVQIFRQRIPIRNVDPLAYQ